MSTHILLVEPDAASAARFGEHVSAFMDARVTLAHAGVDALTLVEAGVRPDVALIAWGEGLLHGAELVTALREHLPRLPIMLVLEEGVQPPRDLDSLGVQGVLTRPIPFPTLPGLLIDAMRQAPGSVLSSTPEPPVLAAEPEVLQSLAAMLDRPLGGAQPLGGHVELTEQQVAQLAARLEDIGQAFEGAPLLLSQDGALVCHAGSLSRNSAAAMARLAGRVWREGATRPAREWLCFKDQIPGEGGERRSVALFSVVVVGDLTLSAAWDSSLTLSALRARAREAAAELEGILR